MTTQMNDKLNKTTICAIAAIEIVDFSKKNDAEQINSKYSLNQLVNVALKEYARYDRILLDKGDGVVMAYLAAPEDMLAIMVDIRQRIIDHNAQGLVPVFVRMGIHLGAVRVVHDVNEQPNFIGEGLNEAQRIMHLAQENGIVVSPAYYAVTLPLPSEIASLYAYSGFKKDAKATEYQAYALDSTSKTDAASIDETQPDSPVEETFTEQPGHLPAYQPAKNTSLFSWLNWKIIAASLAILLGLYGVITALNAPKTPEITMNTPEPVEQKVEVTKPVTATIEADLPAQSATAASTQDAHGLLPNETIEELPKTDAKNTQPTANKANQVVTETPKTTVIDAVSKSESSRVNKRIYKKPDGENAVNVEQEASQPSQTTTTTNEPTEKSVAPAKAETQATSNQKAVEKKSTDKSGWDSFKDSVKQGSQQRACSQGEIALGQCK